MRSHELSSSARRLRIAVTVDGPAGAGKSTVGQRLAEALGCGFLDTGLMYRSVTAIALERGISPRDEPALKQLAASLHFDLNQSNNKLLLDGKQIGFDLTAPDVGAAVSVVSAQPEVRHELVKQQRKIADAQCIVMAGRDIGTVVLPKAPVKLWINASFRERVRRRGVQQLAKQERETEGEVISNIRGRDELDSTRAVSPLRPAADASVIETDGLTLDQVVQRALDIVRQRIDQNLRDAEEAAPSG